MTICNQQMLDSEPKRKQTSNSIALYWKYFLLFILLSIIGYGILICSSVKNIIDIGQSKTSINQTVAEIQQLEHRMKQLEKKGNAVSKSKSDFNAYCLVRKGYCSVFLRINR
jgi:biopolymer transport protein ExbB/TolQ